ncbi:hypothetical protein [Micromonospora sp. NBC_00421]|uniref:hypothetical protein n=1 Tax=Micromonospora sp. NBC_00421 TaxID=2975976 RepID=UPI002E1BC87D
MTNVGAAPDGTAASRMLAQLRAELPTALPSALSVGGPSPTAGNDLYEAYLFALVLRAASNEGYSISFADGVGGIPAEFRLRRSPGRLPSGAGFTHAILALPDSSKDPLEVHTGVAVIGKSKVAHEADVLVIPSADAQRCRQLGIDPASHDAILVIEGKYYTTPLTLGTGREFLGLEVDLSARFKVFAATITNPSVIHLLEGRKRTYEVGVLPGRKAERDIQERFAQALRTYRQSA